MSESKEGNGSVQTAPRKALPSPAQGDAPPEAFARVKEPPPEPPKKPPFYKRPVPMIILGVVLVAGTLIGILYYLHVRDWESTDDAFIQADVTQLSPRIAGYVLKVNVTDNQTISQGETIVELDPKDIEARVRQDEAAVLAAQKGLIQARDMVTSAQADVAQAQAAEKAAATEANRAQDELQRYQALSSQAVTKQQLANLQAASNSAAAQLDAAKQKTSASQARVKSAQSQVDVAAAQQQQAEAALSQTKLQWGYTTVKAPISGTVTNKSVQPGDYVQLGQPLMALVPVDVYVTANYKETQLDLMKPGQEVELKIDAYPGHAFHGKVDSIQRGSGAAFSLLPPENATGNYVKVVQRIPVKIVFNNDGYRLGPGMSVLPRVKVR